MIKTDLSDTSSFRKIITHKGLFSVIEYDKDISIAPQNAQELYYASLMNVRKRQLIATLDGSLGIKVQAGEMQCILGSIIASPDIQGPGDFVSKFVKSKVTGEKTVKPHYEGIGTVILEPSYKYIILQEIGSWKDGMVIEDGMFLACDDNVHLDIDSRKHFSSLFLGNEGIFNTVLTGSGIVALESMVPAEELITIDIENDIVKIDGDMAVAWSASLDFSVDTATNTFIGSLVSGEGLVNVYSGSGRVLMAPVRKNRNISVPKDDK